MDVGGVTSGDPSDNVVARDLRELRDTADRVVGSVFYGTMLKAMRDSQLKGPYGHGGRGEDVFGAQLHELYAERMASSQGGGLQDALYRSLEKQQRAISESQVRREEVPQSMIRSGVPTDA